jgi:hypothetical protein
MNQSLVLIGRAQRKALSNLVFELLDGGIGSETGKQQRPGDAIRR